jgi:kynurenine formamidase
MDEREQINFAGKTFAVYDLSQRLSNDTSSFEPNPHEIAYTTHSESAAKEAFGVPAGTWPDGEAWSIESVTLTTHSGTHVDAPYHYSSRTSSGAPARTIENLPFSWVIGDAFLLTMVDVDPVVGITATDVRRELQRIGYEPKPNDIALIRTDVSEHFDEPGYEKIHPGMRRDATADLVERGVRLIGIDAWGLDRPMPNMSTPRSRSSAISPRSRVHTASRCWRCRSPSRVRAPVGREWWRWSR